MQRQLQSLTKCVRRASAALEPLSHWISCALYSETADASASCSTLRTCSGASTSQPSSAPGLDYGSFALLGWKRCGENARYSCLQSSLTPLSTVGQAALIPHSLQLTRSIFGATQPRKSNPQIHTHDKYKQSYPQPTYEWMQGRFVMDKNGHIWHRQAGYVHKRYTKTASRLTRLKRLKPLHCAYAAKVVKVGFRNKYWAEPDPNDVPGFFDPASYKRPTRRNADPDLRPDFGDPALRQSYKPPPRDKPW